MSPVCAACHRSNVDKLFWLKCVQCAHFYHHRCNAPPVQDQELIAIINAYNKAKARKPDATLIWRCGACVKGKAKEERPATPPRPLPLATKDKPIVIDDDDDDVIVPRNHPEPIRARKTASSRPFAHEDTQRKISARKPIPKDPSILIIDDPVSFPAPALVALPMAKKSSTSSSNSLVSELVDLTMSDDEQDRNTTPTPAHEILKLLPQKSTLARHSVSFAVDASPPTPARDIPIVTQVPQNPVPIVDVIITRNNKLWRQPSRTHTFASSSVSTPSANTSRRKKFIAGAKSKEPSTSQVSFLLSIDAWMKEKEAALAISRSLNL